jgi:hypothetical protein
MKRWIRILIESLILVNPMKIPWWLWLWNKIRSESRVCPECATDAVAAMLGSRKRYIGHCPICGCFWT